MQITNQTRELWPKGWKCNTKIMGVLNITPDSFSDGGLISNPESALKRVYKCILAGADVIDIGGQSTRPGAVIISPEEELNRIKPSLIAIRKKFPNIIISVDTFYSKVAKESLIHALAYSTAHRRSKKRAFVSINEKN